MSSVTSRSVNVRLRPITLAEARRFVAEHHRHNEPPIGWLFGVGLASGDRLIGVAIAGRPISRVLQDGQTVEITRVCLDPQSPATVTDNAASRLYGALCRAAAALGYRRAITYTLTTERGSSLAAAGFQRDGLTDGGRHLHKTGSGAGLRSSEKPRLWDEAKMPDGPKVRWVRCLA